MNENARVARPMTTEAARKIQRPPIAPGKRYRFYSTLQGIDGNGVYPCLYSGQECEVLREASDYDFEANGRERMWTVRFDDGTETEVWNGEIDGWHFDTGQWHGPFAVERRERLWLAPSSGRFEIRLTLDQATSVSHSGQCDDDVRELSKVPDVAKQLEAIDAETLRDELTEYGAWDAAALADHDENLQRVLWLAAGDIVEEAAADHA